MRKKVFFFLLFACLATTLTAEETTPTEKPGQKVFQGFSGGMMVHTGYLFGIDKDAPKDENGRSYSPQGATFGIGGCARVHLFKHLRTGVEGFVSTMPSTVTDRHDVLRSGSYVRMGYGGVLADACWRLEKIWPYVGATIGGGVMRSLYLLDGDERTWDKHENSYVHKQSFFYVTPYAGIDYCLTTNVHLTFRVDWMLAVRHNDLLFPTGPRVYIGFMFCH